MVQKNHRALALQVQYNSGRIYPGKRMAADTEEKITTKGLMVVKVMIKNSVVKVHSR